MPNPPTLQARRVTVAALQNELASLPEQIVAAQRSVDVEQWMRAQNRQADLPAEIRAARLALLPSELADRWAEAERLHEIEVAARADLQAADARVRDAQAKAPPLRTADPVLFAEHLAAVTALQAERDVLRGTHLAARDDTAAALLTVDDTEAACTAAGVELPTPGPGLRADRRPVATSVLIGRAMFGPAMGEHFDQLVGNRAGDRGNLTLVAGERPQRWLAHYLDEQVYQPPTPLGPTAEDIRRAAARTAEIDALGRREVDRQTNAHRDAMAARRQAENSAA